MPSASDENDPPTQARLIHSALELFAERGYGSTSVKAIAQHAGVSQGLLYNYYPSKAALLAAIFEVGLQDVRLSWQEVPEHDPLSALRRLLDESFRLVREHASFWRLFYALRSQRAVAAELGEGLSGWSMLIHERLTRYCADFGLARPEVEARVLLAFIDGVAQQLVLDDAYPLTEVTAALLTRYALIKEDHDTRLA